VSTSILSGQHNGTPHEHLEVHSARVSYGYMYIAWDTARGPLDIRRMQCSQVSNFKQWWRTCPYCWAFTSRDSETADRRSIFRPIFRLHDCRESTIPSSYL